MRAGEPVGCVADRRERFWPVVLALVLCPGAGGQESVPIAADAVAESAAVAAEQEGRFRAAFDLYLRALQTLPETATDDADLRLRTRIVAVASKLEMPPPVPEDALRFLTWATVAFKDAQGREGVERAAAECRRALRLAPWHAPAIFNMALIQEKLQQYDLALANMRLYLQAAPRAPNRDQAQAKVFELEYRAQRAGIVQAYGAGKDDDVPKEPDAARAFYEEACNAGIPRGCSDLAALHVGRDPTLTISAWERGCELGDGLSCFRLAEAHMSGWTPLSKNEARASQLLQRACDADLPEGCGRLAFMYLLGQGVPKDASVAKSLDERAIEIHAARCERGEALSCCRLQYFYRNGVGVKKDKSKAKELLRRAHELGMRDCE